ncbi:hypothetical protein HS088_TW09G00473 [Tripterygium wilfordii]|uniref:High chlorophyll fluorescence 153 n=1 Tax=Tripterygium wilfordii TaxID=458696 RepID=A0A7J7D7S7_TRIWF|nr:uncharacterized protein LOC120006199 [Tripterygium wilfordii]KAF5742425.1 hypothetical protein HS088_TW09G00473 [Tripterygium wilfordii]
MASLLIFNSTPLALSNPPTTTRATFKPPHVRISPAIRISGNRRQPRGIAVVTRAGTPSTSSYVFAITLPLSLLAVTVFTSLRIADRLDRDYLEELAINEAIKEAEEGEREEGDVEIEEEEESAAAAQEPELPRTRNRPKREVEA